MCTAPVTKERRNAISVIKGGTGFCVMCPTSSRLLRWSKTIMSSFLPNRELLTKKWTKKICMFLRNQKQRKKSLIQLISTRLRRLCSVIRSLHLPHSSYLSRVAKTPLAGMISSRMILWLGCPSWVWLTTLAKSATSAGKLTQSKSVEGKSARNTRVSWQPRTKTMRLIMKWSRWSSLL